jgi:hypothetical protein
MIVIFALGTRGDIFPILDLVSSLRIAVTIVTNRGNERSLRTSSSVGTPGLSFEFISSASISATGGDKEAFFATDELFSICQRFYSSHNIRLVMANLFSLAGFILADALNVPCVLIALHPPTSDPPASFRTSIENNWPSFTAKLTQADHQNEQAGGGRYREGGGQVTWADYEQFLWPTLSAEYDDLRALLDLPHPDDPNYALPMRPTVLLANSPFLLSTTKLSRCRVIGSIQAEIAPSNSRGHQQLPDTLRAFIDDQLHHERRLVCVDFGSMTALLDEWQSIGCEGCTADDGLSTWSAAIAHLSQEHCPYSLPNEHALCSHPTRQSVCYRR